jgi:hypothetical protein
MRGIHGFSLLRPGSLTHPICTLLLIQMLFCGRADGFTIDVREMAMGEVRLPGTSLTQYNFAYHALGENGAPSRSTRTFSLPLGLFQFKETSIGTGSDPLHQVNLLLVPPWHLQIDASEPLLNDIILSVAGDSLRLSWEDALRIFDQKSRQLGNDWTARYWELHRNSSNGSSFHVSVRSSLTSTIQYQLDERFFRVLAGEDTIIPIQKYQADAVAAFSGFFTINIGTTKSYRFSKETEFAFGISPAFHLGLLLGDLSWSLQYESGDAIFPDTLPHQMESGLLYRSNQIPGFGFGYDFGVAIRHGGLDFGIGIQNLATKIYWPSTKISDLAITNDDLEAHTYEIMESTMEEPFYQDLDPLYMVSSSFVRRSWIIATNFKSDGSHSTMGLGLEYSARSFSIRGGFRRDFKSANLPSFGLGIRLNSWLGLDLALAKQSLAQQESATVAGVGLRLY